MQQQRKQYISSWQEFAQQVRPYGCRLLSKLDNFPNSVLVSGCQRSGTTMMADIVMHSRAFDLYHKGKGTELKGALILSGHSEYKMLNRCCFHVTYLNDCYHEIYAHANNNKLIWLIRNPYSVIHSMTNNWPGFALVNLFNAIGHHHLEEYQKEMPAIDNKHSISNLLRACLSYNAKIDQMLELYEKIGSKHMFVLDYDELVRNKERILPKIFEFIDHEYDENYGANIHNNSVSKYTSLPADERNTIEQLCAPFYNKAMKQVFKKTPNS